MAVQYRLTFLIYDTSQEIDVRHTPVLEEFAELDVSRLTSIGDRDAIRMLYHTIANQLIARGSTVLERRAIVDAPPVVDEADAHRALSTYDNDDD